MPPPPDSYLKVTLQDVGEELRLLREMDVYSLAELWAMRNQLVAAYHMVEKTTTAPAVPRYRHTYRCGGEHQRCG